MRDFVHYAEHPVTRVNSVVQGDEPSHKPRGLWLSTDATERDSWHFWCQDNEFHLEQLAVRHGVTLAQEANVLWLDGADAFVEFCKEFGGADGIRWAEVASLYQGIGVLCPWDGGRQFSKWDCASVCIWDASAVLKCEP